MEGKLTNLCVNHLIFVLEGIVSSDFSSCSLGSLNLNSLFLCSFDKIEFTCVWDEGEIMLAQIKEVTHWAANLFRFCFLFFNSSIGSVTMANIILLESVLIWQCSNTYMACCFSLRVLVSSEISLSLFSIVILLQLRSYCFSVIVFSITSISFYFSVFYLIRS